MSIHTTWHALDYPAPPAAYSVQTDKARSEGRRRGAMGARRSLLGACSAVSNADPTQCIFPPQVPGSHRGTYIYFLRHALLGYIIFSKVGTGDTLIF